jgi:hypothetical protein
MRRETKRNMYKKKNNTSKRRRTKSKKNNRKRHSRKHGLRGGNFGGHCPDPNFSIYNTNLLKLFPYSTFGKG